MKMLILLLDIIVLPKMLNNNHQFLSEDNSHLVNNEKAKRFGNCIVMKFRC